MPSDKKKIKWTVRIAAAAIFILIIWGGWHLLEYASYRILISKNILPRYEHGRIFIRERLSVWSGGLDNTEWYTFQGYNDSLQPGEMTYADQYGYIHGDSLPLPAEKAPGTVRIVLTGGSGMKGMMQNPAAVQMWGYPTGCYDYTTSIAGKLRHILSEQRPDVKWEVINAAVVQHQFNQSYARYYEKIHDIKPDIIINMDGFNDDDLATDFEHNGDPYIKTRGQSSEMLRMHTLEQAGRYGYTAMLLAHSLYREPEDIYAAPAADIQSAMQKKTVRDALPIVHRIRASKADPPKMPPVDSFEAFARIMRHNMQKQFWVISSYEAQLHADSVYSVFCFQPMLKREGDQKKLSLKEKALLQSITGDPYESYTSDTVFLTRLGASHDDVLKAFCRTGIYMPLLDKYYFNYFMSDYISKNIDSIVSGHGGSYVDIGKEIKTIGEDKEFYVDDVHTTPYANEYIAKIMAREVMKIPIPLISIRHN